MKIPIFAIEKKYEMVKGKVMNHEELHFLGIKVVYKHLIDNGYEVLNVRKETDIHPQILATKEGKRFFILVSTSTYPDMGILLPQILADVLPHAKKHKAECLFAGVGIANANGDSEEEMAQPVVDGEFYINFKGLVPVTN